MLDNRLKGQRKWFERPHYKYAGRWCHSPVLVNVWTGWY